MVRCLEMWTVLCAIALDHAAHLHGRDNLTLPDVESAQHGMCSFSSRPPGPAFTLESSSRHQTKI